VLDNESVKSNRRGADFHPPIERRDLLATLVLITPSLITISTQIHNSKLNGDDKLCHSPSQYRFKPSAANNESNDDLQGFAGSNYVAQVENDCTWREFHYVIGKDFIDAKVHDSVDWFPTLVSSHILRKATCFKAEVGYYELEVWS